MYLILVLIIRIPAIQNKIRDKAETVLNEQLQAATTIGYFSLGFPKKLKVHDVLIKKGETDTIAYLGEFSVNIKLFPLLNHKIIAQKIELKEVKADIGKLIKQLPSDSTASDETQVQDSGTASWKLSVNKLSIESSYVEYRDEDAGFNLIMDIGTLFLHLGYLDLDTLIACKKIEVIETKVSYESLYKPKDDDTSAFDFADIRVKNAHLIKSGFTYIDSSSAILFNTGGDKIDVSSLLIDITNESISLDKALVENSAYAMQFLPKTDTPTETGDKLNWGPSLWRIEGNELELDNFRFAIDYEGKPDPTGHFNNQHMDISKLKGELSNFILDEDIMQIKIHDLRFNEKNGLDVLILNGNLTQEGSLFSIKDMEIETPNSKYLIGIKTTISPTNYTNPGGKELNIDLDITSKNWNEIDYFYPLKENLGFLSDGFPKGNFKFQAKTTGGLNDLAIGQFNFSYLDSTQIIAKANIKDLLNSDSLQINLDIEKLMASKHDVEFAVSQTIMDSVFPLPSYLIVSGNYNGNAIDHHFSGEIISDVAHINIATTDIHLSDIPEYKVDLTANFKDISKQVNMDIAGGALTMKGEFIGNNLYGANGNIALNIDSIEYKSYNYKDIHFKGEIADGNFGTKLNSLDSNLHFLVSANGDFFENNQDVQLDVDIVNINLKALNLHKETFTIKGDAYFAASVTNDNSYDINANIKNLDFNYVDTVYKMHPVKIHFLTNNSQTLFDLESYYYNANFTAEAYILDIANSLKGLPGYYLSESKRDSVEFRIPEFQLNGELEYPEAFAKLFFPDFPSFEKLVMNGAYTKSNDRLNFSLFIPSLQYNTIKSDSFNINLEGTSKELDYNCHADIAISDLINGNLNLDGKFQDSKLITNISYFDSFANQYLDITAQIDTLDGSTIVHIIPEKLIFSYDNWDIEPDNQISIKGSDIGFRNFELSSGEQKIAIYPYQKENSENLELQIENIHLSGLESLLALDTIVDGNADIKFSNLNGKEGISGNLAISDMIFHDFDLGKLDVNQFSFINNIFEANISMNGKNENISLKGKIDFANTSNPLDIDLNINKLNLDELNYMLSDYVDEAKGNLKASFQVSGTLDKPIVNGNLNFENTGAHIKAMDNYFSLGTESISMKNNTLEFDNFTITNKQNQSAKIMGSIALAAKNQTYSDLRVKTDNMEILNNTAKDNDLIFGLLTASADIDIKGTPSELTLDADIEIDKSTNITYVFPDNLSINDNSGVVKFSKYTPDTIKNREISESNPIFNIEAIKKINAGINIDKGAQFKLFFDSSGDNYLDASIDGDMNYNIQNDNSEITGMFKVEEGKLHYSIPMVTVEDFTIEPGSFITMTNDMYNPHLNIIASAGIRASTESLMADYKKVMTFKVLLYLIGDLNDIKIRFDISTQTNDAIVSAKLAQLTDSERNINALNLLVRGSFVISVHGSGAGSTTMMAAQIDKFYANQLNHMISDNIHFVDLHFDVQSYGDYSESGQEVFRRNYYYNVGKKFFHDRVRVNYKGRFGVSTDVQSEESTSTFVQNQLEVEYFITKNGVFRGVFFRKDQYEGLLEGEVIETGGGIRIKKDFYSIKDIFMNVEGEEKEESDKK